MKKAIITIWLTLCVMPQILMAQEPVFHEDFEQGIPKTFFLMDKDGNKPMWALNFPSGSAWASWIDPNDDENKVAASTSYYEPKGTANDWMVLPKIVLPEDSASCQLYWRSRSAHNTYKDGYMVLLNKETNLSPKQLVEKQNWESILLVPNSNNPASWNAFHADLSRYAGKEVYLAFVNGTIDGWMLFIDDIFLGKRESVNKVSLKLATDAFAMKGKAVVKAEIKAGIIDTLSTLDARLTVAQGDTIYEKIILKDSLKPNSKTMISLKKELLGVPGSVIHYKLEIMDSTKVLASDHGKVAFVEDLDGEKCILAEGLINRGQNGGFGVRLIEGLKKAREKYGDKFIGVQVHGPDKVQDDLTAANQDDYIGYLTKSQDRGYGQGVLLDRVVSGEAYDDIIEICEKRMKKPLICTIHMGGTCDDDYIQAKADCVFGYPLEEYTINYEWILVEDSVWSSQWNAYSGGLFGDFLEYEQKPLELPVCYDGVMRGRSHTDEMIFDKTVQAGDTISLQFQTSQLEQVLEPRHLKVILVITDAETNEVINANECLLDYNGSQPPLGVEEHGLPHEDKIIEIYDLSGKRIVIPEGKDGRTYLNKKGFYILKVKRDEGYEVYKMFK